jgi:hypothetical protein
MSYRGASFGAYSAVAAHAAARGEGAPFYAAPHHVPRSSAISAASDHAGRRSRPGSPVAEAGAGGPALAPDEAEDAAAEWAHVAFASVAAARLARLRSQRGPDGDGAADAPRGEHSGRGGSEGGARSQHRPAKADSSPPPPSPTPHSSGGGGAGGSDGRSRRLIRRRCVAPPGVRALRIPADSPCMATSASLRSFYAPDDGLALRARLHLTLDKPSYSPMVRAALRVSSQRPHCAPIRFSPPCCDSR